MWIGVWPPSKRTPACAPEREPAPLWPRPEVLPVPEPSPRPTRLRSLRDPGRGLERVEADALVSHRRPPPDGATEWIRPRTVGWSSRSTVRPILPRPSVAASRAACGSRRSRSLHLGDVQRGHQAGVSSAAGVSRGRLRRPVPRPRSSRPSTSRTVSPRSSATWRGSRSDCSAAPWP